MPQYSREHDLNEKIAEAKAELDRLRALLAAKLELGATDGFRCDPSCLREYLRIPSTTARVKTKVSHIDEAHRPEGVSVPGKHPGVLVVSTPSHDSLVLLFCGSL